MKINKKKLIRKLIIFDVILMLFLANIIYLFHIPTFVKYLPDVLNIIIGIYICSHLNTIINNKYFRPFLIILLLLFMHIIISFIINNYSIAFLMWGVRNILKFVIISCGTILSFESEDIIKSFRFIHIVYMINFLECIFQYFILKWKGDYLGGIFSYGNQGGNGPLVVLIILELIIILNQYLNGKEKLSKLIFTFVTYIIISALAELKFAFILFAIINLLSLILNKKSLKIIVISCVSIAMAFIGVYLLNIYFPATKNFFTYESLLEYTSSENHGYATENDLSRTRAFKQINDMFFVTKKEKLFGFGLGNCSVIQPFKKMSNFYFLYGDTLHYTWLAHAYIYMELGTLGFLYILGIFILFPIEYRKIFRNDDKKIIFTLSALIAILMMWYNEFLVYEYSYFFYVFLAIPIAIGGIKNETNH